MRAETKVSDSSFPAKAKGPRYSASETPDPVSEPMSQSSLTSNMKAACGEALPLPTSAPSTLITPVPPFPKPGAEVELDLVLALGERAPRRDACLEVEDVVEEDRPALQQVEAVAAEAAALRGSTPSRRRRARRCPP